MRRSASFAIFSSFLCSFPPRPHLFLETLMFPSQSSLHFLFPSHSLFSLFFSFWGCMHTAQTFLCRKSNQNISFLLPWISSWFFVGFQLFPQSYAQSLLRKPSFLVLASFFSLVFKNQATALFSLELFNIWKVFLLINRLCIHPLVSLLTLFFL